MHKDCELRYQPTQAVTGSTLLYKCYAVSLKNMYSITMNTISAV